MRGFTRTPDGDRIQWWPPRLVLTPRPTASRWFDRHGWQTGTERTPNGTTASICMPGLRRVFGQTFHFGRVKLCLGGKVESACQTQAPPSDEAPAAASSPILEVDRSTGKARRR